MIRMRAVQKVLGALAALAIAAGCAGTAAAPGAVAAAEAPATPEMIAQGSTIYGSTGRCAFCHGQNGQGSQVGPNLADAQWIWIQPGQPLRPQLARIIRDGIPNPRQYPSPMPAMGGAQLSEQQIQAVAAFVESLSGR